MLAGESGRVLGQLGEISKDAATAVGHTGSRAIRDLTLAEVERLLGDFRNAQRNEKDPEKRKLLQKATELLEKAKKVVKQIAQKARKLKDQGRQTPR